MSKHNAVSPTVPSPSHPVLASPTDPIANAVVSKKDAIKSCFASYDIADAKVKEAQSAVEAAKQARGQAVKALFDLTGSKGPYNYKGDEFKIKVRGDLYFFTGKGASEVIDVD